MVVFVTFQVDCYTGVTGTIYEYGALTLSDGDYIQFKQFAGKVVLFVNVASYCGLTAQYPGENAGSSSFGTSFVRRPHPASGGFPNVSLGEGAVIGASVPLSPPSLHSLAAHRVISRLEKSDSPEDVVRDLQERACLGTERFVAGHPEGERLLWGPVGLLGENVPERT